MMVSNRLPIFVIKKMMQMAAMLSLLATPTAWAQDGADLTPAQIAQLQAECDGGDAESCFALGVRYRKGQGMARDMVTAEALFARACDGAIAEGCFNAGIIHGTGDGVPANEEKSLAFYVRACDGGIASACNNVGRAYYFGDGVKEDKEKALFYVRRALEIDPNNEQAKNGLRVLTGK